ncbi:ADP-heptose:LPS heptosyltransferase [Modestobacter italicus]|uniref:ADP-heptose:LPS heptosyltransferase n=1 Tax=Modestobacter italicus (strain DSM 44449 / CECT 9708 / BC 501) TaxID=2732864 RepID=I4ERG8_MODI5|nr:glycosyltransferase family 9 protein [Modestobacter marinus]CCH85981.1 ADP-heptose:LPS heptosyltransferase [Modestobacter marinus]
MLVARLDNAGDVLLQGPLVRAVAHGAERVVFLASPQGTAAAELLPGVDEVVTWHCPWIDGSPQPVDPADIAALTERLRGVDEAVVSTSFHQSPLPLALVLRLAGVGRVSAISVDYPGSLLDVRHRVDDDLPEPERALSLARAAGFELPDGDDGRLAVRRPLPALDREPGYVVLHPGASVPARAWPAARCAEAVEALTDAGYRVLVTGGPGERALTAAVAGSRGTDLGGATTLAGMAALLDGAAAVVVGNTGPAHLAAAVGTPVVSLFSPVVPAVRWAPYGVPTVLLGDQSAPCRDTRARECPVPGHPCLSSVTAADVVAAVGKVVAA